jgi:Ca2+:H+ antiporter
VIDLMPRSAWIVPLLSVLFYGAATAAGFGLSFNGAAADYVFSAALLAVLFATVFAAVYHAEVVARRTGEPYGTLVLTIAVTVIELALIASIMLGDKPNPALARDTVFAVVMIICNGLVGLCILSGGLRYREQGFRVTGANIYLTVLMVFATLSLVLPNYVNSAQGPVYTTLQLAFVSVVTLALYGVFLYTQTVRHRDYFIVGKDDYDEASGHLPSNRAALASFALLIVCLVAVVLLAKKFAVVIDAASVAIGAPPAFAGLVVALLILLPESVAALASARRDELQKSINLALGSSLATIGLTIPVVAVASILLHQDLVLGLEPKDIVLLTLTILVSLLTFGTGRTNILFGFVHLVIFATFAFLVFVP